MSLAVVTVQQSEFDYIFNHLYGFKPKYGNMHMRETNILDGETSFQYFHALRIDARSQTIEGVVNGPNIFCEYQLKSVGGRIQVNVFTEEGETKEKNKLTKNFVKEICSRVKSEQENKDEIFPRYKKGSFYLRRKVIGTSIDHPNCQAALNEELLDERFLKKLHDWKLQLIHAQKKNLS